MIDINNAMNGSSLQSILLLAGVSFVGILGWVFGFEQWLIARKLRNEHQPEKKYDQ